MMNSLTTPPATGQHPVTISRVGFEAMSIIADLNRRLFAEERIINRFDRRDLIMLLAQVDSQVVGFKIGYGLDSCVFYSAKGGVIEPYRRAGVARALLVEMIQLVVPLGYSRFTFDTFPNIHVGMALMAVDEGFVLTEAQYSDAYRDYRLRFTKIIGESIAANASGVQNAIGSS